MLTKEKPNREFTKIKSREHGDFFISFSSHSKERMVERSVNMMEVISSICVHSNKLFEIETHEDIVLLDKRYNLSVVLSVSKTDKELFYVNVITVMNGIPLTEEGHPKFETDYLVGF